MSHPYRAMSRHDRARRRRLRALDDHARALLDRYCTRTGLDRDQLPDAHQARIREAVTGNGTDFTTWPWSTSTDWLAMAAPPAAGPAGQVAADLAQALAEARWHATRDRSRR